MICCLTVLLGKKKFLLIPSLSLVATYYLYAWLQKSLDPSPLSSLCSYWGAASWSCLFSRLNEPLAVNFLTNAPALTILIVLCCTLSSLFMTFLYSEGPKLGALLQMWFSECWVADDHHFPWSAGYYLVKTVSYAVGYLCFQIKHCLVIFSLLPSGPQHFSSDLSTCPSFPQPVTIPWSPFPGAGLSICPCWLSSV